MLRVDIEKVKQFKLNPPKRQSRQGGDEWAGENL